MEKKLTTKPTEDQESKTAAEQGDSADATGSEDQSSSENSEDTASGKPGENDGEGNEGTDELAQLRATVKTQTGTINQMRTDFTRSLLENQVERFEADNRNADKADAKAVEDGTMTATEATEKNHERRDATQSKIKAEEDKERDTAERVNEAIDRRVIARLGFTQQLGIEFDLTLQEVDDLNLDMTIKSEDQMRNRAEKLKNDSVEKSRKGKDKFDSGQRGAASLDVDKMSAMEKIRSGVGKMGS